MKLSKTLTLLSGLLLIVNFSAHANGLQIGQKAPEFSLPNQNNETIELNKLQGQWVVLYFYPKDETPGCTTEACSFRDNINRLIAQNAKVIGVSLDSVESHRAFADNHQLPFDLLADVNGETASSYGALTDFKFFKFAKRHSFIINPEGIIERIYRDVNPKTHVREVLSTLNELQKETVL